MKVTSKKVECNLEFQMLAKRGKFPYYLLDSKVTNLRHPPNKECTHAIAIEVSGRVDAVVRPCVV
jgi:hypothetical protein